MTIVKVYLDPTDSETQDAFRAAALSRLRRMLDIDVDEANKYLFSAAETVGVLQALRVPQEAYERALELLVRDQAAKQLLHGGRP